MEAIKSIRLTHFQWLRLKKKLMSDHKPSTVLIRNKMRIVLGFTDRSAESELAWGFEPDVELDFFSESKKTMFLLRYSDYLDPTEEELKKKA